MTLSKWTKPKPCRLPGESPSCPRAEHILVQTLPMTYMPWTSNEIMKTKLIIVKDEGQLIILLIISPSPVYITLITTQGSDAVSNANNIL